MGGNVGLSILAVGESVGLTVGSKVSGPPCLAVGESVGLTVGSISVGAKEGNGTEGSVLGLGEGP